MGDITLDITNQKIYWSISDKIESSNVDGTGRSTVRAILPGPNPQTGISYFSGAIYYTNYYTIKYSAINGTGGETVLLSQPRAVIYGLDVFDVSNQPLPGEYINIINCRCVSSYNLYVAVSSISSTLSMYLDIHVLHVHVFILQILFPHTAVFNECQTSLHNCDVNAICTDLEQGYTCSCKLGYVGDGLICTDKSSELY